jgi:cytochrome c oxidase assembly protein Cox11
MFGPSEVSNRRLVTEIALLFITLVSLSYAVLQ